ncbi:GntR family transcriptional regulator [Promicromonospora thailandica]|uniref:DNA-binding transcriptional regulator, LacI/PurR family n=1 Tax=Promicromonospora thailandica TaxID=765201 RepID=A0A9X2G8V3_9MICO|nr:GntR family transcriptional regulator [Promicromonospora thailandica]MCP2267492.1 DNA-binding transcriptional regulator, LacI/PurR family [Promicromonospora thailandica]BFF17167.1 GntR family transcriptional regulator [Promicromonospora thailandica]
MSQPLYVEVYQRLRDAIHAGTYGVGDRMPAEAELTKQLGVSAITLKRAMDLLRADGYITRRPRLGTVVVSETATSAAGDRSGPAPLIGCVLTDFDDTFGTRVLAGLLDASGTTANLVVKRSLGDGEAEGELVRALVADGVQGLILEPSSSQYVPPAVLELVARSFPVAILDRVFDGVPVSSVCSDNVSAGRQAAETLFTAGYDHVGLVSAASTVSTVQDRLDGVVAAHATRHVPFDPAHQFRGVRSTVPGSGVSPDDDVAELEKFLDANPGLTGVVATEYNIAVLLREAARRAGRTVPDDLGIVCFDHPDAFYDQARYRFTHVRQDETRMGRDAVDLVLAQIRGAGQVTKVTLPTELVPGSSTR